MYASAYVSVVCVVHLVYWAEENMIDALPTLIAYSKEKAFSIKSVTRG